MTLVLRAFAPTLIWVVLCLVLFEVPLDTFLYVMLFTLSGGAVIYLRDIQEAVKKSHPTGIAALIITLTVVIPLYFVGRAYWNKWFTSSRSGQISPLEKYRTETGPRAKSRKELWQAFVPPGADNLTAHPDELTDEDDPQWHYHYRMVDLQRDRLTFALLLPPQCSFVLQSDIDNVDFIPVSPGDIPTTVSKAGKPTLGLRLSDVEPAYQGLTPRVYYLGGHGKVVGKGSAPFYARLANQAEKSEATGKVAVSSSVLFVTGQAVVNTREAVKITVPAKDKLVFRHVYMVPSRAPEDMAVLPPTEDDGELFPVPLEGFKVPLHYPKDDKAVKAMKKAWSVYPDSSDAQEWARRLILKQQEATTGGKKLILPATHTVGWQGLYYRIGPGPMVPFVQPVDFGPELAGKTITIGVNTDSYGLVPLARGWTVHIGFSAPPPPR